jgi:hypothetical protein
LPVGEGCERVGGRDRFRTPYEVVWSGEENRRMTETQRACVLAQENIERTSRAILGAAVPARSSATQTPWNRQWTPAMTVVAEKLALTSAERRAIERNGFVVLSSVEHDSFTDAYRRVYREELPLFVSVDSILHSAYASNRLLIEYVEKMLTAPIALALSAMHTQLAELGREWNDDQRNDVDLYLSVARSLFEARPESVAPMFAANRPLHRELVAAIVAGRGEAVFELFGRSRVVDLASFLPRGPYDTTDDRRRYFRGASFLSRFEFNLVSRSCRSSQPGAAPDPSPTPREALAALALAELAERSGALARLETVGRIWDTLAGPREDVSLAQLAQLRREANIRRLSDPSAFDTLTRAIGSRFQRTARTHPMPQGASVLPVIATILGPRVHLDGAWTRPLVHDDLPARDRPFASEFAYALGLDRAQAHLTNELQRFEPLRAALTGLRTSLAAPLVGTDLYGAWFEAIRAAARPIEGIAPSFAATDAYQDLRINTVVAGYGQLRHNYVAMAAESYDGLACRIPDAYVEPAPGTFRALAEYARRAKVAVRAAEAFSPTRDPFALQFLDEFERTVSVLQRIAEHELSGAPLTDEQKRFAGFIAEVRPSSMGSPLFTGWYFDLFPTHRIAFEPADFISSIYTSRNAGRTLYFGASSPRLAVFVVDTNGPPRLAVGPVARAFEHWASSETRLRDRDARRLTERDRESAWSASYSVSRRAPPAFSLDMLVPPRGVLRRIRVDAPGVRGRVVIEWIGAHEVIEARGAATLVNGSAAVDLRWTRPHPRPRDDADDDEDRTCLIAWRAQLGGAVVRQRFPHVGDAVECAAYGPQWMSYRSPTEPTTYEQDSYHHPGE